MRWADSHWLWRHLSGLPWDGQQHKPRHGQMCFSSSPPTSQGRWGEISLKAFSSFAGKDNLFVLFLNPYLSAQYPLTPFPCACYFCSWKCSPVFSFALCQKTEWVKKFTLSLYSPSSEVYNYMLSRSFSCPVNDLLVLSIILKVNIYPLRFGVLSSQIISSLMIHIHDVYGIFWTEGIFFFSWWSALWVLSAALYITPFLYFLKISPLKSDTLTTDLLLVYPSINLHWPNFWFSGLSSTTWPSVFALLLKSTNLKKITQNKTWWNL